MIRGGEKMVERKNKKLVERELGCDGCGVVLGTASFPVDKARRMDEDQWQSAGQGYLCETCSAERSAGMTEEERARQREQQANEREAYESTATGLRNNPVADRGGMGSGGASE